MPNHAVTIAAIGCTGEVSREIVNGFFSPGVHLRILARNPEPVKTHYPQAEVFAGSMMNPSDVARITSDVDAALLITPMGMCDNPAGEIEAARKVIAGVKSSGLNQLVYLSVLGAEHKRGVGILDAKHEIERCIQESGVPHTILRCGSYMEDVFDPRLKLLNKGWFFFPIDTSQRFSYTSQADIPRFIVRELLPRREALNRPVDFVAPCSYRILEVEEQLSKAAGFRVKTTPRLPVFYLFYALLPYFRARGHRFSSVIPLMRHFDRNGYFSDSEDLQQKFPEFRMTPLNEHLKRLFSRGAV